MIFAIAGGIAWFFQNMIFAVVMWSFAGIVLLKLNERSRSKK